ncbi:hypothetical protein, partial [Burkholderia gladioli]|uniref:hypothetical protein n=1 Tax=Burkholderia gladioli TaxID=28095 RepID=UPI001ABABA19
VAVGASHAVFASRDQGGYIVTDRSRYFNGLLSRLRRFLREVVFLESIALVRDPIGHSFRELP